MLRVGDRGVGENGSRGLLKDKLCVRCCFELMEGVEVFEEEEEEEEASLLKQSIQMR
jgi:hypothetical protein